MRQVQTLTYILILENSNIKYTEVLIRKLKGRIRKHIPLGIETMIKEANQIIELRSKTINPRRNPLNSEKEKSIVPFFNKFKPKEPGGFLVAM